MVRHIRAHFVGDGKAIADVRRQASRLANFPFPILITGETGTGKYELALLIHEKSKRCAEPFVEVHCPNLSQTLFESELFGHERGAFTDAREQHPGKLEQARHGTVLFDEVDCLDGSLQAKLLRLVDRRTYERVGGHITLESKAGLVFSSNRDLWALAEAGLFRNDLLTRLAWAVLRIPPLREHPDDITLLAGMFLEEARLQFEIPQLRWDARALEVLRQHSWPGNVRELKSVTYAVAYLHDGLTVSAADVEEMIETRSRPHATVCAADSLPFARTEFERARIVDALRQTDGNRVQAARLLKIGRRTLQGKIAKYGL